MSTIENIALTLRDKAADIQLLYAFNSVGKTRPKRKMEHTRASTITRTAKISLYGIMTLRTPRLIYN